MCGEWQKMKGGTGKYCALITLDVKNAFDSGKLANIMKALYAIMSYFGAPMVCDNGSPP